MTLDVCVLGPVSVLVAGRERSLRGSMQQALLARLLLARGQALPPAVLIDELWGQAPPRDPPHALQARVSRLRSALGVDVQFRRGGYLVDPQLVRTDADRFEELRGKAAQLLASGDFDRAGRSLHEALKLWHGPAFVGLLDVPALRAEAARLEEIRAVVLIDRIDVDLSRGKQGEIIPELHALVEEQPLVERHWAQLMLALYGQGRPHEALDIFNRANDVFIRLLRTGLRDVDAAGELTVLRQAILQHRPAQSLLRWPPTI